MRNLTDIGRVIFAIPFAVFGINHFINWDMLSLMYNSFIPIGVFMNLFVGLAMIAAAVSIILKKNMKLSCLLLALMLLVFIGTIHIPQIFSDQANTVMDLKFAKMLAINNMMKDLALMGGAILIAGLSPKENVRLNDFAKK